MPCVPFHCARASAFLIALGTLVAGASAGRVSAQASLSGSTLDDVRGSTVCMWRAYLEDRVPLVRGRRSRIRVQAPQADVGLNGVRILGGAGCCRIARQKTGVQRELGYVELEIDVTPCAPLGEATLELSYTAGKRTYQLVLVEAVHVDSVSGTARGPSDRLVVQGRGLSALEAPPDFTTVEQDDTRWVLAPAGVFCRSDTRADYRAPSRTTGFCGVRLPHFAIEPGPGCQASAPAPAVSSATVPPGRTDLVPGFSGVPIRASGIVVATHAGGVQSLPDALCNTVAPGMSGSAMLPSFSWSVSAFGDAPSVPVNVQLIETLSGAVRDTLTLRPGESFAHKQGYLGRPNSAHVVRDPGSALGPTILTGPTRPKFPGCFSAPGTTPQLDPPRFTIRVDPENAVDEGPAGESNNTLEF